MAKEKGVKKNVKLKDLKHVPMWHEKLPPELETRLRAVWQSLGILGSRTFEHVETKGHFVNGRRNEDNSLDGNASESFSNCWSNPCTPPDHGY